METVIAVSAAILVCIQAHRNHLMVKTYKELMRPKEDRTADILEKIYLGLEKDRQLKEVDRRYSRKANHR